MARVRKYEIAGRAVSRGRPVGPRQGDALRRRSRFSRSSFAEGRAERPRVPNVAESEETPSSLSSLLRCVLFKFVLIVLRLLLREIVAGATSAHSMTTRPWAPRDTHTHTHAYTYIRGTRERDSQRHTHTVRRVLVAARTEWKKKERERARERRHVRARTHRRGRLLVLGSAVVSSGRRIEPIRCALPPTTRRSFLPSAPAEFVKPKRHRRARTTAFRR